VTSGSAGAGSGPAPEPAPAPMHPGSRAAGRVVLLMGVSGAGKSAVGRLVADELGARLIDADDLHSAANVERMRAGLPLRDEDRAPWLRDVHAAVAADVDAGRPVVLACSALKRRYRTALLAGFADPAVVLLQVDRPTLDRRLRNRPDHFMPAGLLDSQLHDLEPPHDAIVIPAVGSVRATAQSVVRALRGR
jgi:gluconokinase